MHTSEPNASCQSPDAQTALTRRRRAWLAALLSLSGGPLGQVYTGHFRRSMVLWLIGDFLFWSSMFLLISLPLGRVGLILILLCILGFPLYLAVDAFRLARRNRNTLLKKYQRWWIYILVFFAFYAANNGAARVIRSLLAEAFVVPGGAMSPTMEPRDRILVDKLWSSAGTLRRNDVVVFYSEGPDSPLFVMRVVGLPGDEIQIKDERVFINGEPWDDCHAVFEGPLPPYVDLANYGPTRIPSDCFFVLGDNRRRSKDSRLLGPIPLSSFCGKARIIYWSRPRMSPDPDDPLRDTTGPIRWDRMGTRLD